VGVKERMEGRVGCGKEDKYGRERNGRIKEKRGEVKQGRGKREMGESREERGARG